MSKMVDFQEMRSKLLEVSDAVDASLEAGLSDPRLGSIVQVLTYDQQSTGKRLRPTLASFISLTLEGDFDKTIEFATGCELLHSASLMLDDHIDGDDTRRGRPTVSAMFGGGMSMMGTYILALFGIKRGIAINLKIGKLLVDTTERLVVGGTDELCWEGWDHADYFNIIRNKTVALFEAPCILGAIAADGGDKYEKLAENYGYHVGMAYQLSDDYVDIAKSIKIRQPIGDIKNRNTTTAIIHCYENTGKPEIRMILDLYRKKVDLPDAYLRMILDEIEACNSMEYLRKIIDFHMKKAEEISLQFPDNEHRDYLTTMPSFMVDAQMQEIDMPDFT